MIYTLECPYGADTRAAISNGDVSDIPPSLYYMRILAGNKILNIQM